MKRAIWRICWIALFAAVAGCGLDFTPEPTRTFRAIARATNEVAEELQRVRDADSARAAADTIDRKCAQLCELWDRLPEIERKERAAPTKVKVSTAKEALESLKTATSRMRSERERLEELQGLPIEFWKIFESRMLDLQLKALEAVARARPDAGAELYAFDRGMKDLLDRVGYERVVKVDLVAMRFDLADKAREKLRQVAPGATVFDIKADDKMKVVLGPVADFKAFTSAIDFGDVVFQNETKRLLRIRIHPMKLGARAETSEEENELARKENEENARKAQKESEKQMARARAEAEKQEAARSREESGGDPNDPAYYDRLAEMVASSDYFKQEKAVKILLRTSPSQVTFEQKKKIAKAFKQLAEDDRGSMREEAIKGLVIWGGKYSGPILLRMLEDARAFEEEHVIKALGDIKYAKAAPALAAKLGDFFLGKQAGNALRKMGEEAEDAVLAVAPSPDPKICLPAVELLGDCGTKKSLPLLRRGATSRNFQVREASKEAIRKILARQNAAKTDDG